jgi:hypothetical protein
VANSPPVAAMTLRLEIVLMLKLPVLKGVVLIVRAAHAVTMLVLSIGQPKIPLCLDQLVEQTSLAIISLESL